MQYLPRSATLDTMSTSPTPDPLTIQVQAIRNSAHNRLYTAANAHTLARSALGTPAAAESTRQELHMLIRNIHAAKIFTAPEIAEITHLSRSRVYQILAPAPAPLPQTPTPTETRLPETDV